MGSLGGGVADGANKFDLKLQEQKDAAAAAKLELAEKSENEKSIAAQAAADKKVADRKKTQRLLNNDESDVVGSDLLLG